MILNTSASDSASAVANLCAPVRDLAIQYYKDCGERVRERLRKDTYLSAVTTSSSHTALPRGTIELAIRLNIKMGFYGEYSNDLNAAVMGYSTAHSLLNAHRYGIHHDDKPVQWQFQRRIVADMCNYRLCKIFMKISPQNAIVQFRKHTSLFKNETKASLPATNFKSELLILHHFWLEQQYKMFSDMLQLPLVGSNVDSVASFQKAACTGLFSEGHSLFYLQAAAKHSIAIRRLLKTSHGVADANFREGEYVGSFIREDVKNYELSDKDFILKFCSLAADESFKLDSVTLLRRILDSILEGGQLTDDIHHSSSSMKRYVCSIKLALAKEYLRVREVEKARTLFYELLPLYRLEGWEILHATALMGALRCARTMKLYDDMICWSLEAASLNRALSNDTRISLQGEAMKLMLQNISYDDKDCEEQVQSILADARIRRIVCKLGSALRSVFQASVSFSLHDVKPRENVCFELAILSNLPSSINLDAIELCFGDQQYNQLYVSPLSREKHLDRNQHYSKVVECCTAITLSSGQWYPIFGSLAVRPTAQPMTEIVCRSILMYVTGTSIIEFPFENGNEAKRVDRATSFGKSNSIWQSYHKRYGVKGATNNKLYSIGTCQPIIARNDYSRSRLQQCPVLSNHHPVGLGLPIDSSYNYNNEIVVYPATAQADVRVYLDDDLDCDPLVGEIVPINVDITPKGESIHNPCLYFQAIDIANSDLSDALEIPSQDKISKSKASVLLLKDGKFTEVESYCVDDGLTNVISSDETKTITFYLRWHETASTDVNVVLRYTTDVIDENHPENSGADMTTSENERGPKLLHFECQQQITLRAIEPFHTEIHFEEIHGTYTLQNSNNESSDKDVKSVKSSQERGRQSSLEERNTHLPADTDVFMVSTLTCLSNKQLEILNLQQLCAEKDTPSYCRNENSLISGKLHNYQNDPTNENDALILQDSQPLVLSRGEIYSKPIKLKLPKLKSVSSSEALLGSLVVSWRRVRGSFKESDDRQNDINKRNQIVSSSIQIPRVYLRSAICQVKCKYDDKAYVGSPFQLEVTLLNRTSLAHEFRIVVGDAGSLLYTGCRISRVVVLPHRDHSLQLLLISTAAGIFKLPTISVSSTRFTAQMETQTVFIHVLPRRKDSSHKL